jgi:hypothetical protein
MARNANIEFDGKELPLLRFETGVETALKKLEIPGGPKLQDEQLERVLDIWLPTHFQYETFTSKGATQELKGKLLDAASSARKLLKNLREIRALSFPLYKLIGQLYFERLAGDLFETEYYWDTEEKIDKDIELAIRQHVRLLERGAAMADRALSEKWPGRGKGADLRGREIAEAVAQIYMELRNGELPTFGLHGVNGKDPATPYTWAVHEVFSAIGLKMSFRSPCEKVVKRNKTKSK